VTSLKVDAKGDVEEGGAGTGGGAGATAKSKPATNEGRSRQREVPVAKESGGCWAWLTTRAHGSEEAEGSNLGKRKLLPSIHTSVSHAADTHQQNNFCAF
jgi:hypothetical protein